MNIIVNASMMRASGTLSIYRQFIHHLPFYKGDNRYYIFVDSSMDQPDIDGVTYVHDNNHSKFHYIWWSFCGLNRWLKEHNIEPSVIVSLQNTGTYTSCRQVIYYHNPLPFYKQKWSFLKSSERSMAVYKHIYPYIVKSTITSNTKVVVQIPFIKRGFISWFKFDPEKVYVLFPDVEKIESGNIEPYPFEKGLFHFLFPATNVPYKGHCKLVRVMDELKKINPLLASRIRIHLTLKEHEHPALCESIKEYDTAENFVFHGIMPHEKLLSFYKAATGLLFPSTIETLGLPLLEAGAFGLPIIVSDLEYAHEVLDKYEGAKYIDSQDYKAWAVMIEKICEEKMSYQPIVPKETSWKKFFEILG